MQTRNAASPERLLICCIVVEGRHEDDRKRGTGSLELSPQFNSRHAAEMDIEEEAVDLSCGSGDQGILRQMRRLRLQNRVRLTGPRQPLACSDRHLRPPGSFAASAMGISVAAKLGG